jgi:hypothetical protein
MEVAANSQAIPKVERFCASASSTSARGLYHISCLLQPAVNGHISLLARLSLAVDPRLDSYDEHGLGDSHDAFFTISSGVSFRMCLRSRA